jgi:hypothetical protein
MLEAQMTRGRRLALVGSLLLLVAMVIFSPALMVLAAGYPLPWQQLGDVGQAYGAVSAIVSALALLGIAVSLVIQQRQNRMMEEQAVRQRHSELVRLTIEDQRFLYSWGAVPTSDSDPALLGFSNLIVSHWLMLWRIRNIDEATLRRNAQAFFAGSVGRDHWRHSGPGWATPDRRSTRFVAIMTEELEKAVAAGPPLSVPPAGIGKPVSAARPARSAGTIVIAGLAIAGAIVLTSRLIRRVAPSTDSQRKNERRPTRGPEPDCRAGPVLRVTHLDAPVDHSYLHAFSVEEASRTLSPSRIESPRRNRGL